MKAPTLQPSNSQLPCPLSQQSRNRDYEDGMAAFTTCDAVALRIQSAAESRPWLKPFLKFGLIRSIAECAFGTFHWNKGYLKLPHKNYEQGIDTSEMPMHFRYSYLLLSTVIASIVTFLFGASLAVFFPEFSWLEGGGAMLMIAGTGWVLQTILATWQMGSKKFEYLSHMASIMWLGVLPLLPAALLLLFLRDPSPQIPMLAVGFSSLMMLRQHFIRLNSLQTSQVWTLSWLLSLQSTAWLWIAIFFIF